MNTIDCKPMSAKISEKQCNLNQSRNAYPACKGCPERMADSELVEVQEKWKSVLASVKIGDPRDRTKCRKHPDRPSIKTKTNKFMGMCKECSDAKVVRMRAGIGKGPRKTRKKYVRQNNDFVVMLDFADHDNILSYIHDQARSNFRTVSNEILYRLSTMVTNDQSGKEKKSDSQPS
jgi:hypothetical protein